MDQVKEFSAKHGLAFPLLPDTAGIGKQPVRQGPGVRKLPPEEKNPQQVRCRRLVRRILLGKCPVERFRPVQVSGELEEDSYNFV